MANAVIDFQVSDVCGGGGHATVTMRRDGVPIGSKRISVAGLKAEAAELNTKDALWEVGLEIIRTVDPTTRAELGALINTMTITLDAGTV